MRATGEPKDHGDRRAHAREGNGAALLQSSHRSPLLRVLSSNILAAWLSRMRSFGHRCFAAS
jgi:hypothetical protein